MEVLLILGGMIIGSILTVFLVRSRTAGVLWIDKSGSEDRPPFYLELSKNVDDISNRERVKLTVKIVKYDISQK